MKKILFFVLAVLLVLLYFKYNKREGFDPSSAPGTSGSDCSGGSKGVCNTGLVCVDDKTNLINNNSPSAQCKSCQNLQVDPTSVGNLVNSGVNILSSVLGGGVCKSN